MLKASGFDRVWLEPAMFPTWSRGFERVAVRSPVEQGVRGPWHWATRRPHLKVEFEAEVVMLDDMGGAGNGVGAGRPG